MSPTSGLPVVDARAIDPMISLAGIEIAFEMDRPDSAADLARRALAGGSIPNEAFVSLAVARSMRGLPDALRDEMACAQSVASLTPLAFLRPSTFHYGSALEACLDALDEGIALRVLSGLSFPIPRKALAAALRRSEDAAQSAARLARADRAGLADAALLRMLSERSSWCANGIAEAARAERERRALSCMAKPSRASTPGRRPRI